MAKSARMRTCSAFLYNSEGKVIAQLRDDKPGLMFPGRWSTLGGRVEDGETPDEAMRRELIEEIEVCPSLTFWRVFEHGFTSGGRSYEVDIYAYMGAIETPIEEIHLHEGQRLAYLSAQDVNRLSFAFRLDHLYREFFTAYEHRTRGNL